MSTQKISPCLWFNNQGEDAAKFYTSLFKNSKLGTVTRYSEEVSKAAGMPVGSVLTVEFSIENFEIMALNGGTMFKFNPSFSFFVYCESEEEITSLWSKLIKDGEVRMRLDKYPWAKKYGFAADRFGVNWQLILNNSTSVTQKVVPSMLFVRENYGRGNEAIEFYTSVFKNSKIDTMTKDEKTGNVMHCVFQLEGVKIILMEGAGDEHKFKFNEAFSQMICCETQEEIDYYWNELKAGGGTESYCGWLKDKFGVSWQVAPARMYEWAKNPTKHNKMMSAMMTMKKLDLQKLETAYNT